MQFYGPDEKSGNYGDEPSVYVPDIAKGLHTKSVLSNPSFMSGTDVISSRLLSRMTNADKAVRISVRAHEDIEDWVSDDGPLVVIGEAAHPFPVRPLICNLGSLKPNTRR